MASSNPCQNHNKDTCPISCPYQHCCQGKMTHILQTDIEKMMYPLQSWIMYHLSQTNMNFSHTNTQLPRQITLDGELSLSYPGLPHIHLHISCACSAIVGSRLTCFSCSCVRFWTTCCCAVPEFPAACFAFVQCGGHLSVCASRLQSLPMVVPSRRHKQRACLRPELSCPIELLLASRWHLNPNYNRFLWYHYDIFVAVLKKWNLSHLKYVITTGSFWCGLTEHVVCITKLPTYITQPLYNVNIGVSIMMPAREFHHIGTGAVEVCTWTGTSLTKHV